MYKGGDIEREPEVQALLLHIAPFFNGNRAQDIDRKIKEIKEITLSGSESNSVSEGIDRVDNLEKIQEKSQENSLQKSIEKSQMMNSIDSVVAALSNDGEMGFDEVGKYYGVISQNANPIALKSMPEVIEELLMTEEIKVSRRVKIEARHEKQEMRKLELESLSLSRTPITIYSSSTVYKSPNFYTSSRSHASTSPSFTTSSTAVTNYPPILALPPVLSTTELTSGSGSNSNSDSDSGVISVPKTKSASKASKPKAPSTPRVKASTASSTTSTTTSTTVKKAKKAVQTGRESVPAGSD